LKLTSIANPLDVPSHKLGESLQKLEGNDKTKSIEENAEQLTRSGLTEEHGLPITSDKPSYSSDSTQNSNKRKRTSPINTISNGTQVNGNAFRIRLPMQKHKEPAASAGRDDPCSTSGRTDPLNAENKYEAAKETNTYTKLCSIPVANNSAVNRLSARPDNGAGKIIGKAELQARDKRRTATRPSAVNKTIAMADLLAKDNKQTASRSVGSTDTTSAKVEILLQNGRPNNTVTSIGGKTETYGQDKRQTLDRPEKVSSNPIDKVEGLLLEDKKSSGSRSHKKAKRTCENYANLFTTWVPPVLANVLTPDSDDQDWLFADRKHEKSDEDKRLKLIGGATCGVSHCAIQPVAHYLPQADIYALPYCLPF
jgi:hypothetical protein